jgi:hypothetical protein
MQRPDTDTIESSQRRIVIDIIAGIYGLATLVLFWLCFNGTDAGRIFGMILTPISAITCIGIGLRVNAVRIGLVILLGIALIGEVLFVLYFVGVLTGEFRAPPNKDPQTELIRVPLRAAATLFMLLYLLRSDVRDAFRRGNGA